MPGYEPISSSCMFNALKDEDCIIMACNTRTIVGLLKGIFRAAKELDAAVIFELAKSECNLEGGYTGITPAEYGKATRDVAEEAEFDIWALHADHLTVKNGTKDEIAETKKLIEAQVDAGYTSFAIDASFLFNEQGKTAEEQLARNIAVTTELAKFIKEKMGKKEFGLEVEVGEIGKKDEHGRVLTTPEEAVTFIKKLNENGIFPNAIAVANGTVHGDIYDEAGNIVQQTIDIELTIRIANALKQNNLDVRIVQHGITGTPIEIIEKGFPKKAIVKGNVGTTWQNIVWDVLNDKEPELFNEIWHWVLTTYKEEAEKKGIKSEKALFGKFSKNAFKQFKGRIHSLPEETVEAIEEKSYETATIFFRAFNAAGSAQKVRDAMK